MTEREKTNESIIRGYSLCRPHLTPEEKPYFDKVVKIVEELGEIPAPTDKLAALDSCLVIGLTAVALEPPVLLELLRDLGEAAVKAKMANILAHQLKGLYGSRNSH